MNTQTKNNLAHDAKCSAIGTDMEEFERELTDLSNRIHELTNSISKDRNSIEHIKRELARISVAQDIARAAGGGLGPLGGVAGAITAEIIALARQKEELERELLGMREIIREREAQRQRSKHRLENVNYILGRLDSSFKRLGCNASHRPYR